MLAASGFAPQIWEANNEVRSFLEPVLLDGDGKIGACDAGRKSGFRTFVPAAPRLIPQIWGIIGGGDGVNGGNMLFFNTVRNDACHSRPHL